MKVSVCITTYNLERYIEQTLMSIIKQKTTFDYEIIISDDCSTDETRNILLHYKEKFPEKIFLNFQNHNVGVNRNNYDLIFLARGEFIAWCDGDDYWIDEYKLEKEVDFLDKNIKYSCVHTLWRDYSEKSNSFNDVCFKQYDWEKKLNGTKALELLLKRKNSRLRFSSLMHRKNILVDELKRDPSILLNVDHYQNDFAIYALLIYNNPSFLLEDITTVYRIRKESLSQTENTFKRYDYLKKYLNLQVFILKKYCLSKNTIQVALHQIISGLLNYIYNNREYISDISIINSNVKIVNYKYSVGQILVLKSFKYKKLSYLLRFLLKQ